MRLYKGIFWLRPEGYGEFSVISVKAACLPSGKVSGNTVVFSSKSGDNFNHKMEWAKMPKSITKKRPYNYYPRGRVEIKKNKATVYVNPVLNTPAIMELIYTEFGLYGDTISVRIVADGSAHYEYRMEIK